MPMAMRPLGPGQLTLRAMFSLEPATVSGRQYPELFQQGETAFGKPIIDGQHPHNFFMEVAALYDIRLGKHTLLSFYAAPIGDPAIGPTAYPHRLSASEDPIAALGHHQQDSTHIAYNVLTAGLTWRGSASKSPASTAANPPSSAGASNPPPTATPSTATPRASPSRPPANWSGQYSIAHIVSPEALYPTKTSSARPHPSCTTALRQHSRADGSHSGNWSSTLLWGRTHSLTDNSKENSYLVESLLQFRTRNYLWTRIENAGRSNELLLTPGTPAPTQLRRVPHRPRQRLHLRLRPRLPHRPAPPRRSRRAVHHLHHTRTPSSPPTAPSLGESSPSFRFFASTKLILAMT